MTLLGFRGIHVLHDRYLKAFSNQEGSYIVEVPKGLPSGLGFLEPQWAFEFWEACSGSRVPLWG